MRAILTKTFLIALATVAVAASGVTAEAIAQDVVTGTVVADPATVPEPGGYTFTAAGAGFISDSSVLVLGCTAPGDRLVPGESTDAEAAARGAQIDPLEDCDLGSAVNVEVGGDGSWTTELTSDVGDNFFVSAGDLARTQVGGVWVPIISDSTDDEAEVEPEEADPADEAEVEPEEADPADEAEPVAEAADEAEPAEEAADEAEPAEDDTGDEAEPELPRTGTTTDRSLRLAVGLIAAGAATTALAARSRDRCLDSSRSG